MMVYLLIIHINIPVTEKDQYLILYSILIYIIFIFCSLRVTVALLHLTTSCVLSVLVQMCLKMLKVQLPLPQSLLPLRRQVTSHLDTRIYTTHILVGF